MRSPLPSLSLFFHFSSGLRLLRQRPIRAFHILILDAGRHHILIIIASRLSYRYQPDKQLYYAAGLILPPPASDVFLYTSKKQKRILYTNLCSIYALLSTPRHRFRFHSNILFCLFFF